MTTVEIWHKQNLHDDLDYEPKVNQMEVIETIAEWLNAVHNGDHGDSVTLIISKT